MCVKSTAVELISIITIVSLSIVQCLHVRNAHPIPLLTSLKRENICFAHPIFETFQPTINTINSKPLF